MTKNNTARANIRILNVLNSFSSVQGVEDVVVKVISNKDVDVNILLKDKEIKNKVIVTLETKMYLNSNLGIQAIRSIKDGLEVLDNAEYTYKIKVI